MEDFVKEILFTPEQIAQRVQEMGEEISRDYGEEEVVFISVLKGAMVFTADLIRCIQSPVILDAMVASSYGSGTESSGGGQDKLDCSHQISEAKTSSLSMTSSIPAQLDAPLPAFAGAAAQIPEKLRLFRQAFQTQSGFCSGLCRLCYPRCFCDRLWLGL